jgi:hypothetical protein
MTRSTWLSGADASALATVSGMRTSDRMLSPCFIPWQEKIVERGEPWKCLRSGDLAGFREIWDTRPWLGNEKPRAR